jgi:hypothetical protein
VSTLGSFTAAYAAKPAAQAQRPGELLLDTVLSSAGKSADALKSRALHAARAAEPKTLQQSLLAPERNVAVIAHLMLGGL